VRWKHCLLTLADRGVTELVEVGPGGVLTGMAKRTVPDVRTMNVAGPDDLDRLIEFVSGGRSTTPTVLQGEHLFATERLVVSPSAGVFARVDAPTEGARIETGAVLGRVGAHEVRSPFTGVIESYLAVDGERVTARQPIAWLRTV
jgi:[acyl-carrier-protein] S-malonyltransferase